MIDLSLMNETRKNLTKQLIQKKEQLIRKSICYELGFSWSLEELIKDSRVEVFEVVSTGDQTVVLDGKPITVFKTPDFSRYMHGTESWLDAALKYKILNEPDEEEL